MSAIVFLGPSLPADEARRLAPSVELRGPARQGDIWRALEARPQVIALIDGVFESEPSVWHHEILSALAAGVRVFGASSMGALRASELHTHGMEGVGEIFGAYRDGRLTGDDEVALIHADAQLGWRGLTVPLVNVRHTAQELMRARRLTPQKARRLVQVASGIHFRERTWRSVLEGAGLPLQLELHDLKAKDARTCLQRVERAVSPRASATSHRRKRPGPPAMRLDPRTALGSSLVRSKRLQGSPTAATVMPALRALEEAPELVARGLRRMLLSAWARSRGLAIEAEAIAEERARWIAERLGDDVAAGDEEAWLRAAGLDEAQLHVLLEDVLLERAVLENAQHWVSDGPSFDEALASEARLTGLWAELSRPPRR